ncbi:MAG: hypothetical protein BWY19_00660 [bacterium ADurb.Bin212]|nr:MAG: hypothetical protein BWY19_00660 [bacterium ADurb.Bin212]
MPCKTLRGKAMAFLTSKFVVTWEEARTIACVSGYESSSHRPLTISDQKKLAKIGNNRKLVARRNKPKGVGRKKRRMSQGLSRSKQATSTYSRQTSARSSWSW